MPKKKSTPKPVDQGAVKTEEIIKPLLNRRDVLKIGGATAAVAVVSQVVISGSVLCQSPCKGSKRR